MPSTCRASWAPEMRAWPLSILLMAASGAVLAHTHAVAIEGMAFTPALVRAKPGDTIVWTNRDVVPHTVTGRGLDSKVLAPGARWSWRATHTGRVPYVCALHPGMAGTVEVK